jgi:hypothetical protein
VAIKNRCVGVGVVVGVGVGVGDLQKSALLELADSAYFRDAHNPYSIHFTFACYIPFLAAHLNDIVNKSIEDEKETNWTIYREPVYMANAQVEILKSLRLIEFIL